MKNIVLLLVLILGIALESFAEKYPIMMRYDEFVPNDIKNEMTGVVVTPLKSYQRFYFKNFISSLIGEEDLGVIFGRFILVKDTTLKPGSYLNSCWDFSSKWKIETYPGKYYEGDLYEYKGPKIFKGKIFFKPSCGNILLIPDSSLSENDAPFVERRIQPDVHKQVIIYDTIHQNYQSQQQVQQGQLSSGGYWVNSGVNFYPDLSYYYNNNNNYPTYYSGYGGYYGRRTYPILRIRTSTVTNRRR